MNSPTSKLPRNTGAKLQRHWKFSRHFAERFVQRVSKDKHHNLLHTITREFNQTCQAKVFECVVYGAAQRQLIGDYFVCYRLDEEAKQLIVTTIYKRGSKNVDYQG